MGFCAVFAIFVVAATSLNCLDENGNRVDWFVAMKAPEIHDTFPTGLHYFYYDENTIDGGFKLSPNDLNSGGAIKESISQVYDSSDGSGLLMWNDEFPNGTNHENVAHAKGLLHFDEYGGMYIVHSAPKFPSSQSYDYPHSASGNGQSFMCISVTKASVSTILSSLTITRPGIYAKRANANLIDTYLPLAKVLNGTYVRDPVGASDSISSVGGVDFLLFLKNHYWGKFLYEDLVAPTLGSDLIAETWTNGGLSNIIPTFCKNATIHYNVYDAMHVQFGGVSWARTKDHSKWVAGVNSQWGCIGGINRQFSQNFRGGGTVCSTQIGLQKALYNAVIDVNPCGTGQVTDQGSQPPTMMSASSVQIR